MINLRFDEPEEFYQESGIIDDALKSVNIDRSEVKKSWEDASTVLGKIGSLDDTILKKTDEHLGRVNTKMNDQKVDNRSIIARARNSILQFPIYVMQTIRVNEAQIISGLFERVYTTLVQSVLSQNPFLTEEEANDLVFLKKFHTNIKESVDPILANYQEAIDTVDQMIHDAQFYTQRLSENCTVEFRSIPTTDKLLILENQRLLNEPLTGFSYLKEDKDVLTSTHEDEEKTKSQKYHYLSEDDLKNMAQEKLNLSQDEIDFVHKNKKDIVDKIKDHYESSEPTKPERSNYKDLSKYDQDLKKYETEKAKWEDMIKEEIRDTYQERDKLMEKINHMTDQIKTQIQKGTYDPKYKYKEGRYIFIEDSASTKTKKTTVKQERLKELKADPVNQAVDAPKLLKDSDIKKINAMLPYTMEVTFRVKPNEGGVARDVRYIIGIKCVMHIIRPQDIADDLRELITGNMKSLQKIRYKTGEISFKDYFFNLGNIKKDAAKRINYNKRWVNTLKRLSEYDKLYGTMFKKPLTELTNGSIPIPNATLVLTQPDIVTLTNQTGIDLSSVTNAKRLAKNLFLIAIVIVDSSAGSMRVLFPDSSNDWDVYSLGAIDAELTKTDNSNFMRELNKLVNK